MITILIFTDAAQSIIAKFTQTAQIQIVNLYGRLL